MAEKTIINIVNVPQPIGPYSQGVKYGNLVFLSGQIALDPKTNKIIGDDTAQQTQRCLQNIKHILESTGGSIFNVVKITVYLISLDDFEAVNNVFKEVFTVDPPARTTVQVAALPKKARVELDVIACISESRPEGGGLLTDDKNREVGLF